MQVKCRFCGDNSEKEIMYLETVGKTKKYYHQECWVKEQARREEVTKEVEAWMKLYEYIKQVHGLLDIQPLVTALQDLRNGTTRLKGRVVAQSKQGIPYEVMYEAYQLAADTIRWSKQNKNFKDSGQELRYGFAIMRGHINEAAGRLERRKRQDQLKDVAQPQPTKEVKYKPKKSDNDITEFLEG